MYILCIYIKTIIMHKDGIDFLPIYMVSYL